MTEPTSTAAGYLGLKVAPALAGLMGAVVSLYFLANASVGQRLMALIVGFSSSIYLAPLIAQVFDVTGDGGMNAIAFLTGVLSMNIMAGVFDGISMWRRDPKAFVEWLVCVIRNCQK